MQKPRTTPTAPVAGWRAFTSSNGRYWATRVKPWPDVPEFAGVYRTVDADDQEGLRREILAQEEAARQAARSSSAHEKLLRELNSTAYPDRARGPQE